MRADLRTKEEEDLDRDDETHGTGRSMQIAHPWSWCHHRRQQSPECQSPFICHTSKHLLRDEREYHCHHITFCALVQRNEQVYCMDSRAKLCPAWAEEAYGP
jgi:hypothetical protein